MVPVARGNGFAERDGAGQPVVLGPRHPGAHGLPDLGAGPGHQERGVLGGDSGRDLGDLRRRLTKAQHDFREALAHRSMVIDPGKAQVFEGLLPELLQQPDFRLGGTDRACSDALEQGPDFAWCHDCNCLRYVDLGEPSNIIRDCSALRSDSHQTMTLPETLILASYFFVLAILAVYGWHRYYMVYLYMKHKDEVPVPLAHFDELPVVTIQLPDLQRDVRRRPADRRGLRHRLPARAARDPGARRLDRRDARPSPSRRAPSRGRGPRHQVHPPHRPHGLQGRGARSGHAGGARRASSPSSTPTSSPRRTSCGAPCTTSPTRKVGMVQARWGHLNRDYSLLTKIQAILLDGHFVLEHGSRNRGGLLLQLQRHRRHLAARRPSTTPAAGSTTR